MQPLTSMYRATSTLSEQSAMVSWSTWPRRTSEKKTASNEAFKLLIWSLERMSTKLRLHCIWSEIVRSCLGRGHGCFVSPGLLLQQQLALGVVNPTHHRGVVGDIYK